MRVGYALLSLSPRRASMLGRLCSALPVSTPGIYASVGYALLSLSTASCAGGPTQHPSGPSHHLLHDDAGEALRHVHLLLNRKRQPPVCTAPGKDKAPPQSSVYPQSMSVQSVGARCLILTMDCRALWKAETAVFRSPPGLVLPLLALSDLKGQGSPQGTS